MRLKTNCAVTEQLASYQLRYVIRKWG